MDFEIGIVSNISGNDYTVEYYYPAESDLEKGMQFNLENTYCSITYDADEVLTIEHMKESPYKGHPCYKLFELESYIGIPLSVDGKRLHNMVLYLIQVLNLTLKAISPEDVMSIVCILRIDVALISGRSR